MTGVERVKRELRYVRKRGKSKDYFVSSYCLRGAERVKREVSKRYEGVTV